MLHDDSNSIAPNVGIYTASFVATFFDAPYFATPRMLCMPTSFSPWSDVFYSISRHRGYGQDDEIVPFTSYSPSLDATS